MSDLSGRAVLAILDDGQGPRRECVGGPIDGKYAYGTGRRLIVETVLHDHMSVSILDFDPTACQHISRHEYALWAEFEDGRMARSWWQYVGQLS